MGADTTDAPLPLRERDAELGLLTGLVAAVGGGHGGTLVFEARAGLGKSALLDRAAALGRAAGLLVVRARGRELEQAIAWGLARTLFEAEVLGRAPTGRLRLLDGPAAPARHVLARDDPPREGPASDAGFAIVHGLYWLALRLAEDRPLLLVVDDAQWADEPSQRFLAYLVTRIQDAPLGVLAAVRPRTPEAVDPIDLLVGDPMVQVRELQPLGAQAVADVVRDRVPGADEEFCRRCVALTMGNPQHLRELLTAVTALSDPLEEASLAVGVETAARRLERSVLRRLSDLPAPARALAEAVAVFEDDVALHLAAALAAIGSVDAVVAADELVRADMLRSGDPVGFVHPLLRAAVYSAMAAGSRARSHARAARLLADSGATGEQVCAHLLHAPPAGDGHVVQRLRDSAHRALARGAPAAAIGYLERALREPPPPGDRAGTLADLGRAEATAGRPGALAHLEAATSQVEDPRERARLLLGFGRSLHHGGRLTDACEAFQRGLAALPGDVDIGLRVELEGGYLNAALFHPTNAARAHRRAPGILAAADSLTTRGELALLAKALMMTVFAGGPRDRVLPHARRLLADGRLVEEDPADSQAMWHLIATLGWCDDHAAAREAVDLALDDARQRGSVLAFALASVFRARHALWTGPVGDAVHDAQAAVDVLPDDSVYRLSAGYCLVSGLLELGEPDRAATALAAIGTRPSPPFFAAWRRMAAGRAAAGRGDHERALAEFRAVGRLHAELLIDNPAVLPWRSEAALAALALGDPDGAARLVAAELQIAEHFGAPRAIGVARRAAGLVAPGGTALEPLRAAVDVLLDSGVEVEHARALADLGAAIRRTGRPAQARPLLRAALDRAAESGTHLVAAQARAELRLAGGRPTARVGRPANDLTPGERRVVELAARGHSNRQIATALFITVKAVEWHLGNAYRKLGVRNRAELSQSTSAPAPASP